MIKNIVSVIIYLSLALPVCSQVQDPVNWTFSARKVKDGIYELHLTATMDKEWHIYAQQQPKGAISEPTAIRFVKNPMLIFQGPVIEKGKKRTQEIESLGIKQFCYDGSVEFVQTIKLKHKVKTNVSGDISYMACTDEKCLPVKKVSFSILVNGAE
jgi:thiol:disulfide interchange protein DsbD